MSTKDKLIKFNIFAVFLLLPIIDSLRRTGIKDIEIFNISIIEFFYFLLIGISFIATITKIKKKELLPLVIYTIILCIYIVFHDINILKFNTEIYADATIDVIRESYYIIRTYYFPILLLFVLYKNRDILDINFYKKILKMLIVLISFSIVILNIFKISFATYQEKNIFIDYNIFDFYKSDISYKLLSTRGWFDSANEISAILVTLLPINIYFLFKENKKINYLLYIIQIISMIILGTRVSTYCTILISLLFIFINIFSKFVRKEKINYKFIIVAIISCSYYFLSPIGNYYLKNENPYFESNDIHSTELKELDDEEAIVYIKNNLSQFRISNHFTELYPIENDIEFWKETALGDRNENNNSRIMKIKIINRIKERNDNKYDSLLGMGYTINFEDLERDYVYQYYIFGIIGVIILIFPQISILFKHTINILKRYKTIDITQTLLLLSSPYICLVCAYLSGHVFGWISPNYILILSLSILNAHVKNIENNQYKLVKKN